MKTNLKCILGMSRILLLLLIGVFFVLVLTSNEPNLTINVDKLVLVFKEDFNNFNLSAGDCCNKFPNLSKVNASTHFDALRNENSLVLSSEMQCACISYHIVNTSLVDKYILRFNYTGTNPSYCLRNLKEKKCMILKNLASSNTWRIEFLRFNTNLDEDFKFYFYSNSNGSFEAVNYYDKLEVFRLEPFNSSQIFSENESYVIEIDQNHYIKNGEIIQDNTYFVKGIPNIKRKIPETQIFLISLIFVVIILIFYHIKRRK